MTIAPPPLKKVTPLFPSNPPLKVEVLSSPPLWKFGWRLNLPPLCRKGGGVHTMVVNAGCTMSTFYFTKSCPIFLAEWQEKWKQLFYYFFSRSSILLFIHSGTKTVYNKVCSAFQKVERLSSLYNCGLDNYYH